MRIVIEDLEDPRLDVYRGLANPQRREAPKTFIAEGHYVVDRLLASNFGVQSVLIDERKADWADENVSPEVEVLQMSRDLIAQIVGYRFHRGVIACGIRKANSDQDWLVDHVRTTPNATIAVCLGIQDPENLGGILRNCAAFGVDAVVIGEGCVDAFARRVVRVSMGGIFKLNIHATNSSQELMRQLQSECGVSLVGSVLRDDAEDLSQAFRSSKTALLFGNEAEGLNGDWIDLCDQLVTLPMALETDSLNVSVASGVFLYHYCRVAALK